MKYLFSSAYTTPLRVSFRLENGAITHITIPAYALNYEVELSQKHFDLITAQNAELIASKKLIIGKSRGSTLESVNKEATKVARESVESKFKSSTSQVDDQLQSLGVKGAIVVNETDSPDKVDVKEVARAKRKK